MALDMTTALTIKASVTGQGQINGLAKGLGGVTKQTNNATTALGRLKGAAGGALGAMRTLLPALGVAGIAAFAKGNLDTADSMSKLSQRTGIAAPELDKFRKVAELSDTSIESLERAFPALTKNMKTAADTGKGPALAAFNELGVSVKNADGTLRGADEVMLDIADRFAGMADGSNKAALASSIFGTRIGSELIPMLNSGGDAVRGMGTVLTQDFADNAAKFNDRLEGMGEKLGDLGLKFTEALLPALEAILPHIESLVTGFTNLPGPVQSLIVALGGIAGVAAVFGPLITAVTSLGPLFTGITAAIGAGGVGGALSGLAPIIAGIFTGPVGWVALLAGAGVAAYAFRDEIGEAFGAITEAVGLIFEEIRNIFSTSFEAIKEITMPVLEGIGEGFSTTFETIKGVVVGAFEVIGENVRAAAEFFNTTFIQPVLEGGQNAFNGLKEIFSRLGDALKAPFEAAFNTVKGIVNNVLNAVGGAIKSVVNAINNLINGANNALRKLKLPTIPLLPQPSIPQFAKGGMVNGAQLAVVGEAGPEYIVPAGKAQGFARNILAGVQGPRAIPAYAEGGYVGSPSVNIQTGPVTQMNGTDFVTTQDLSKAVQSGVNQTLDLIRRDGTTRASLGLT